MKKNNTLTYPQRIKLSVWASSHKELFEKNSDKQTAEIASKEVGFTVTDRNIQPIRQTLFPDVAMKKNLGNPLIAMFDCIRREVQGLAARLEKLESDLGVSSTKQN